MENQVYQLLLMASQIPQQEQVFPELQKLIENQDSIFELINISQNQNVDINIKFISLILMRHIILNISSTVSQSNYLFLLKISNEIQQKLTFIFYSPNKASILVPQFAALCCLLKYRLDSFYSYLSTVLQVQNLQSPNFIQNIQSILIEIIQNESIYENSFIIAREFLLYSTENRLENAISKDFCQYVYPFLFHPKSSSDAIQILNYLGDYTIIPHLLENISKINQRESIVQFIKLLNSFYCSAFSNESLFLNGLQIFNLVYAFLISMINNNSEEMTTFESILFFFNLFCNSVSKMNSFASNLNQLILPHLNELILSLFEKVGIDKNIEFFGVSVIALKTIHLLSIIFPSESFSIIFSKFESTFSNLNNSNSFQICCSLRVFTKILSKRNNFLMKMPSLIDILKLGINSSMNFIQFPDFSVDSSNLFLKSMKMMIFSQKINENDINMIGNSGFERILHAYSIYDIEIKKKLAKVVCSILRLIRIPLHLFLKKVIETFVNSKTTDEYLVNSYVVGTFIEKSSLLNKDGFVELDFKSVFLNLIQFVINSMMSDNIFFVSSVHILGASITKCPEATPFVISALWPKIIEKLALFASNGCAAFFQFGSKLNNEHISSFCWIMHTLIDVNKASVLLKFDATQFTEQIILHIPLFLNPSLPKEVVRSSWMYLSNLVEITSNILKCEENKSACQLKLFNEMSIIVKKSVLLNFDDFFNKKNYDEVNESGFSVSVVQAISTTVFTILENANFLQGNSSFFSEISEIERFVSVIFHVFSEFEQTENCIDASKAVTCCISIILIQYPQAVSSIREMIEPAMMTKLILSFSSINNDVLKQSIAPGIGMLIASESK